MKKNLKDYLRIIFKNFYIVLLLMILTGTFTAFYVNKLSNKYDIKSIIMLDYEGSYNYEELQTYVKYLKTNDILEKVKTNKNLDMSVKELNKNTNIKLIKNTNLIQINIKDSDPILAVDLSNELVSVFSSEIKSIHEDLNIYIIETPSVYNANTLSLYSALMVSLSISFVLGIILALLFGSDNVNIKNHEDIKKYLDLKSLGIIPNDNGNDKKKKSNKTSINMISNSSSITAEAYRMVRTNLDFLDLKVVNFTSTSVGEGKSETISNIALSFSMIGKKVLLIDCDLRKPKIHKNFNLNRALGLTDILIYNRVSEYKNVVQEFKIPNKEYKIDVISAGSKVSNPSEILSSTRFKELISRVSDDYDLVLIDCPPVSLMTDAVIVSKVSTGTAYVIEYDRFSSSAINKCIEQLKDINANILGGIITKMDVNKQKKLYGDQYEQYYSNYIS